MAALRLFGPLLGLGLLLGPDSAGAVPAANPIIGCPSLVNLRILMRQTKSDMTATAAILGTDGTDHLGCVVLARDAVTTLQEHLTLNGNAYDCLTLRGTSVCHWVIAGAVNLSEAAPKARGGEKGRPADKAASQDKVSTQEKARR